MASHELPEGFDRQPDYVGEWPCVTTRSLEMGFGDGFILSIWTRNKAGRVFAMKGIVDDAMIGDRTEANITAAIKNKSGLIKAALELLIINEENNGKSDD